MVVARNIVVANCGAIPEIVYMARALARAGLLREYITPVAVGSSTPLPFPVRLLPSRLRRWPEERLRRRRLPEGLDFPLVHQAAAPYEYLFQAMSRVRSFRNAGYLTMRLRNMMFDRATARQLRSGDSACVTPYTAAMNTLRRARALGIASFLEYPIAHHCFAERILTEEAHLEPEFAPTLQFHAVPVRRKLQMEAEIALADYIFVLSEFQKQTFIACGIDESKLVLASPGVDLNLFRPLMRPEDGTFRVMFTGQITQRKGISYLFRAFEKLEIPRSELVLAGPVVGSSDAWRQLPRVRHVPSMSRWRLPILLSEGDVHVLPSLVEGFALTSLEAMACGKPVIVSTNTFAGDVIEDGVDGFVVPIRDPDAIAERIQFLYDRPAERRRMGEAARRKALQFSWDRYGQRVTAAIGARVRGHRSPRSQTGPANAPAESTSSED